MLPTIRGKSFLDCTLNDIKTVVDNADYRENEYIDYKETFSFLKIQRGPARDKEISEFRSDICSFANADGGYLIFGISDNKGMAKELKGVAIESGNTDRFELERRDNLALILPQIPPVQFKFIPLEEEKYIVIVYVQHDSFAPYIHAVDDTYKIYKRIGNGKKQMSYVELKNMFTQAYSVELAIQHFREERIRSFMSEEDTSDHRYSRFLLLHMIPETFLNTAYNKNLYVLQKRVVFRPGEIMSTVNCNSFIRPNVDGLRGSNTFSGTECLLYNSGIAELFLPLESNGLFLVDRDYPDGFLCFNNIFDLLPSYIESYLSSIAPLFEAKRYFACLSLIGCKGAASQENKYISNVCIIDRSTINCHLTVFSKNAETEENEKHLKELKLESALALGITRQDVIEPLLHELYPQ